MNIILFFLVAIFGHDVEGTKIRAIRRRTYQYLPPEAPEVLDNPAQTQYNWNQWWGSPAYNNERLVYSYNDPNGIRFNMFSGGPYWNRNYGGGGQVYQSLGQSGSGSGISLGGTLQGMKTTDNSEVVNGQIGYSQTYGANGVQIMPNLGLVRQNLGQISLSSDQSGTHSSASAYSSQIAQNIARSKSDWINPNGDNDGKIIIVTENANGSTNDDNSNIAVVNPDGDSENEKLVLNLDQSELNKLIDKASFENVMNGMRINNEKYGGLIDSVSGNNLTPVDGATYTIDQSIPSLTNDAPIKDIGEEINGNNNDVTTFDQYWPKLISPNNIPSPHSKPNLWGFYKYVFNHKGSNMNEKRKLNYDFPIDIDAYQQPNREYYDMWRQYIRNRQARPHYHYKPYPENRFSPLICWKNHINTLPGRKEQYYDIDGNGRPIKNNRHYIIPNSIYNNVQTPTDVDDYGNEENLDRVSFDYMEGRDAEVPFYLNNLKNVFRSKIKPFVSNDDTDIYNPPPLYNPAYSNLFPRRYKNVLTPKFRPLPIDDDTPSDIPWPYPDSNLIPEEYRNTLFPEVQPVPSEDTLSTTYTPLPYGYKYNPIPKVLKPYPVQTNDDGSDIYNSPVFPYLRPDIDNNNIPLDFEHRFKPNEETSQSQESSEEDNGYDATKDTPEIPDSRIIYLNSNNADKYNAPLTSDKDTFKIFGTPWSWNWNNRPKSNVQSITQEQYIQQVIDALIPHLLKLYYSDCTKENEAKLLRRFEAIIDYVQSKRCDTIPDY